MKNQIAKLIKPMLTIGVAATVLMGWCAAARADEDNHHDEDSDQFFGSKTLLTVFHDLYWRWAYGNGNVVLPRDQNGNAVVAGIALMPLPNADGSGKPASIAVTLKAGQSFFLPLIGLLGTSYTNNTADPFVDFKVFERRLTLKLKVDGRTILDDDDALDFYSEFAFDPPIPFLSPPVNAIVFSQGIGIRPWSGCALTLYLAGGHSAVKLQPRN